MLASSDTPLTSATPHLMPFQIAYTGPAPISTYFRVQTAPEPTFGRETKTTATVVVVDGSQISSDSQSTLVAEPQEESSRAAMEPSASSSTVIDANVQDLNGSSECPPSSRARYYTAAFRGRSMHGLRIDLPEGYSGVVLRAPDRTGANSSATSSRVEEERGRRSRAKAKPAGRATRRGKRAEEAVEDTEEEVLETSAAQVHGEGPTRILSPAAQFSSFVLWHPDIPVDEGRDEYVRSLTEWTKLAVEIHRIEDC
ncbi:hypothetical protein PYCCODRAFT_1362279 [Trametes coccinea BRFM310]|uniref:Uncharacterized protein n=1 Tax=Trametes coccinea (strain BRFM310) TaxID=1353009 RepID=A0A1Y2IZH3_TRAC3|nr:hypothetical protein PYCCODRAFT_1362279 [Trametes coccinea BRFM310]